MPIRMRRQVPDLAELRPLMRFERPELNARKRRLAKALTIGDLRKIAQRRTPKGAFDYTDGAAEGEVSLHRARQAYADVEFHPRVLRDVSTVDPGWEVLGQRVEQPFGIAPTGFTRMMQSEGERAGVTAAAAAGIPFTLSTMGTTSIEDVATTAPNGRRWFQLYVWNDRAASLDLVRRADAAGYDTLLITVDTPVAGNRMRDIRNGFTVPPSLTLSSILDAARHPAWWIDFLTTEPLAFASLSSAPSAVIEQINAMFDPTITDEVIRDVRRVWPGKLVIKGVQSVSDAREAVDQGADAVLLSNHGGRQLDRAPVPFYLLPEVVREVGRDVEVHIDTGITNGADVVAAIAHGARFTLVGRAYLYGLMAGGREGVSRMIEIMSSQIRRTMQLLGVASLAELEPSHVTQLQRLHPRTR